MSDLQNETNKAQHIKVRWESCTRSCVTESIDKLFPRNKVTMTDIEALLELAKNHFAGLVDRSTELGKQVFEGLVRAWPYFSGSSDQRTYARKLDRMENLAWSPPNFTFCLERHGGTVNGSTRADLHFWVVNLETGEAWIERKSYRQLTKKSKNMDCAALAHDIAAVIRTGENHAGFVWEDGKNAVSLKISNLIPMTFESTTTARRKRFRAAFIPLMIEQGWEFRPKGNVMRFMRANGGIIGN